MFLFLLVPLVLPVLLEVPVVLVLPVLPVLPYLSLWISEFTPDCGLVALSMCVPYYTQKVQASSG